MPENFFITISTVNSVNSRSAPVYPSGHLSFPPVLSSIHVAQLIVVCAVFCRSLFVHFLSSIVPSVLLLTTSGYLSDIFKTFVT